MEEIYRLHAIPIKKKQNKTIAFYPEIEKNNCMEIQKTANFQKNLSKEEQSWRHQDPWL